MEHRRRRPQGIQTGQTQQEIQLEKAQGVESAASAPQVNTQETLMQQADVSASRRRRRAQLQQDMQTAEHPSVQHGNTEEKPLTPTAHSMNAPDMKIPKLPREDVHVVEETWDSEAQKLRRRAGGKDNSAWTEETKTYDVHAAHRNAQNVTRRVSSAATSAGKTALSGGKTALGFLGGMLLLAAMLISEGFSKVRTMIKDRWDGSKSRVREEGHAPAKSETFELEAIRPQDYHGSAQHRHERTHMSAAGYGIAHERAQRTGRGYTQEHSEEHGANRSEPAGTRSKADRKKMLRMPSVQQLLSLVFAVVALVSFYMIVSIMWRSVRTRITNKKLTEIYTQASENVQEPEVTPELVVFMPEGMQTQEEGAEQEPAGDMVNEIMIDSEEGEEEEDDEEEVTATKLSAMLPETTTVPISKRTYHHIGGDALPQMEALHKENRDIVGWLNIENVLDLPVVYKDNSYYLTRDFYKQKNTAGTIFLDENHPFKEKTQNLLLHGHNMKDGTMFGRLVQYETDLNYVRWHPFIKFDTLWRKEEYVIFAVLRVSLDVSSDQFFNYFTHATFSSDAEFDSYIRQLQLRSLYAIPIDVKPTDALLTLSTCLEDDRLVIVARRVRSEETHTELREATNLTRKQ